MVAFVGTPVTARDIFERWKSIDGEDARPDDALDLLEGYVRWVSTQKLGTIFEAAYDTAGVLVARRIANAIPVRRSPIPE
jgi:hypothetical protein